MSAFTTVTTADLVKARDAHMERACDLVHERNVISKARFVARVRTPEDAAMIDRYSAAYDNLCTLIAAEVKAAEAIAAEITGRMVRVYREARLTSQGI